MFPPLFQVILQTDQQKRDTGAREGLDSILRLREIGSQRLDCSSTRLGIAADQPDALISGAEQFGKFIADRSTGSKYGDHPSLYRESVAGSSNSAGSSR
jgi:hypothetical protein